jgi:hypothetical protein
LSRTAKTSLNFAAQLRAASRIKLRVSGHDAVQRAVESIGVNVDAAVS